MIENLLTKLNPTDLEKIGRGLEVFYSGEWGSVEDGFFCGVAGKVSVDLDKVKLVRLKEETVEESEEEVEEVEEESEEEVEESEEEIED